MGGLIQKGASLGGAALGSAVPGIGTVAGGAMGNALGSAVTGGDLGETVGAGATGALGGWMNKMGGGSGSPLMDLFKKSPTKTASLMDVGGMLTQPAYDYRTLMSSLNNLGPITPVGIPPGPAKWGGFNVG